MEETKLLLVSFGCWGGGMDYLLGCLYTEAYAWVSRREHVLYYIYWHVFMDGAGIPLGDWVFFSVYFENLINWVPGCKQKTRSSWNSLFSVRIIVSGTWFHCPGFQKISFLFLFWCDMLYTGQLGRERKPLQSGNGGQLTDHAAPIGFKFLIGGIMITPQWLVNSVTTQVTYLTAVNCMEVRFSTTVTRSFLSLLLSLSSLLSSWWKKTSSGTTNCA